MADFQWTTGGGILMDSTGDIAISTGYAETQDLVVTRVKASVEDWKMYNLSANLETLIGNLVNPALQTTLQRQVSQALSDILTSSQYQVKVLMVADTAQLYVFVNNTAVVSATITTDNVTVTSL